MRQNVCTTFFWKTTTIKVLKTIKRVKEFPYPPPVIVNQSMDTPKKISSCATDLHTFSRITQKS